MALTPVINKPLILPIIVPVDYARDTGEVTFRRDTLTPVILDLLLQGLLTPIEPVEITVTVRASFLSVNTFINLYAVRPNGFRIFLKQMFRGPLEEDLPCREREEPHFISIEGWLELLAGQPPGSRDQLKLQIQTEVFGGPDFPAECPGSFHRLRVAFRQEYTEGQESENWTWFHTLGTTHNTLVANADEERGVPHVHKARFAINRRTGKYIVLSESEGGQITRSGCGVAPGDDDGERIPTRGLPGTIESVSTGRLKGRVVRLESDGSCILV